MSKSCDIIQGIFSKHHAYYKSVGVETTKQQAGQYKQVSDAYQGRVVFELLQNAIDRADKKILISLVTEHESKYLVVANDGEKFTYDTDYDYVNGNNQKRCDFQSLCSIATSTKDAAVNIGNKGVGFKSVFSISHFADIYTLGRLKPNDEEYDIDFRIYDTFTDCDELKSFGLDDQSEKLQIMTKENRLWGIPGYYFPQLIQNRPDFVSNLFNQGFITIVVIPVVERFEKQVESRINDMKRYQFDFICEKAVFANKDIMIEFRPNDSIEPYSKRICKSGRIFSKQISEKTYQLGMAAVPNISKESKVSICFRSPEDYKDETFNGYIYNFLPTEIRSFFRNIDINADFQTSVDRKSIAFSDKEDEPVGAYNRALLNECIELYVECIENNLPEHLFAWNYLKTRWTDDEWIRYILKESLENHFESIATTIIKTRSPKAKEDFDFYYAFIVRMLSMFHPYNCGKQLERDIAYRIGQRIASMGVQFLPDTPCVTKDIFVCNDDQQKSLPSAIWAEMTKYRPGAGNEDEYDWHIRNGMGLKEFSNVNEILKLYCQCSMDGQVSDGSISEEEQISILASIASLTQTSKNKEGGCTYRYKGLIDDEISGKENDSRIRADFALSTVFYKTNDGKFRPGQLVKKTDIDPAFLKSLQSQMPIGTNIDYLLQLTGVSNSTKYNYADARIWAALGNGIDYCPAILNSNSWKIVHSEALKNVTIFWEGSKQSHPAVVNENYSIFANIPKRQELDSLSCGDYNRFTPEYFSELKSLLYAQCLKANVGNNHTKKELLRFYSKYFQPLYSNGIVLVKEKGKLYIDSKTSEYICVFDERVLELDDLNMRVLCYASNNIPDELNGRKKNVKILFNESESIESANEGDINFIIRKEEIIKKILIKISHNSSMNSYEGPAQRRKLFDRINSLYFHEMEKLVGDIEIDGVITSHPMPYMVNGNDVYLEANIQDQSKYKHDISWTLSIVLFDTEIYSDIIYLVLFAECWIDKEELNNISFDTCDLELPEKIETTVVDLVQSDNYVEFDMDNLPDFEMLNLSNEASSVNEIIQSRITQKESQSKSSGISEGSVTMGEKGEAIVIKYYAKKFMEEFMTVEERSSALKKINEYLTKYNQNIIRYESLDLATISGVASALWYTKQDANKYAHFDVITFTDNDVLLIEIKSTSSNNIFRLSKREAETARNHAERYKICRVRMDSKTIIDYGNPLKQQLQIKTDNGLIVRAAGYDILTAPV